MKKFFITLAAIAIAVSTSAQVYVGGNVGLSRAKSDGADAKTQYSLLPEVGYNINNDWAIGTEFGWTKGSTNDLYTDEVRTFEIAPYARYTFFHSRLVNAFFDGTISYGHVNATADLYTLGLKPGIAVNLTRKLSFVAHIGFFGYKEIDYKDNIKAPDTNVWGVNLDGNNVKFGILYNF